MKIKTILACGIFTLILPVAAIAADKTISAKAKQIMQRADLNNDGKITTSEAAHYRGEIFDKADRNNDGFINPREKRFAKFERKHNRQQRRIDRRVGRLEKMDSNSDGNISVAEFTNAPSPLFDQIDANNDGTISKSEFIASKKTQFARLDVNSDGVLNKQDKKDAKSNRRQAAKLAQEKLDANEDGRISREEFTSTNGPLFVRLDLNGDGIITSAEVEKLIATKSVLGRQKRK